MLNKKREKFPTSWIKGRKFPTCWIKPKRSPLQGVLTLKNTYFEPRYVLVMPLDKEAHEHRLRDRGLYSEEQIEHTLKRADIYCKYNQDHPGFFDMMISSGELFTAKAGIITLVFLFAFPTPSADMERCVVWLPVTKLTVQSKHIHSSLHAIPVLLQ